MELGWEWMEGLRPLFLALRPHAGERFGRLCPLCATKIEQRSRKVAPQGCVCNLQSDSGLRGGKLSAQGFCVGGALSARATLTTRSHILHGYLRHWQCRLRIACLLAWGLTHLGAA